MGYYLTDYLAQAVADDLQVFVDGLVEVGSVVTVIVADLSCRANWNDDKTVEVENEDGLSPLVLLERTYGEVSSEDRTDNEKLAETGLMMMDREGTSLDALFTALRQNIEEGDLFPSSDAVGLVAGHLAICAVGLDQDANSRIMNEFRDRIVASIAKSLADDDRASESNYVAEGAEDEDSASAREP